MFHSSNNIAQLMKDFGYILILQKTMYTFVNLWTNFHIHLKTIIVPWQLDLFELFQNRAINNLKTKVALKREM